MTDPNPTRAALALATAPPEKSLGVALLLWLFFATFGGPWWYLGRPLTAIGVSVLYWGSIVLTAALVGFILLPVVAIVDLASISSMVKRQNRERTRVIFASAEATSG